MHFVTVSEAAEALGLSEATVRNRLRAGNWPCYRFGDRSIRLKLEEIMDLSRSERSLVPQDYRQRKVE